MIDDIKKQIDINKKNKEVYKEYIDSFINSDKIKAKFIDNDMFKSIIDKEESKKEDDYF